MTLSARSRTERIFGVISLFLNQFGVTFKTSLTNDKFSMSTKGCLNHQAQQNCFYIYRPDSFGWLARHVCARGCDAVWCHMTSNNGASEHYTIVSKSIIKRQSYEKEYKELITCCNYNLLSFQLLLFVHHCYYYKVIIIYSLFDRKWADYYMATDIISLFRNT